MLSVSDAYLKAICADTRDMPYRVTFAKAVVMGQTKIPKMTLTESASNNSNLSIGTANSASLKLTLKDAVETDYTDVLVEPESGLTLPDGSIEWVPLGKFWVTEFSTANDYKTVSLTCADGMYLMSGDYESELTYPAPVREVVQEITSKTGVEFVGLDSLPDVIIRKKPEKMTYRDAIGYAAGCCGKNARFNRYGQLEFYWYEDTGIVIEGTTQYLNGMNKLNYKPLSVNFEVSGAQEKYEVTVVSDDNGGITATPGGSILEGDTVTLSINPFDGYELASITAVTETGSSVTLRIEADGLGYTFIQPDSNVTVTASFRENVNGPFKLTVRSYDYGDVSYAASGNAKGDNYFNKDDVVVLTITPEDGYEVDVITTTPSGIVPVSTNGTVYRFAMPQSDVTVGVKFKKITDLYLISRLVSTEGHSTTNVGFIHVTNKVTGEYISQATAGTLISVRFAGDTGFTFDKYESDVDMVQTDKATFQFVMPANAVSIVGYFKEGEDDSKVGQFSWLPSPGDNPPPTAKPYWAVIYRHNPSNPVLQNFYLVWFDSWSTTSYTSDGYGKRLYKVTLKNYYYCRCTGTDMSYSWNTSSWSGNGSLSITWEIFVGGHTWSGDPLYTGDYCLLASNVDLYNNSTLIFQKCPSAIGNGGESYIVDGMDVREKGSLGYYKCPDSFSTPAPASNWMILSSYNSLLMEKDESGLYFGVGSGWSGLFVVWYDDISIENVGAVFDNSEENFYIATVTNGHYARLVESEETWGTLYDIADGRLVGLRSPHVSEKYAYSTLGLYYFNGLLATSRRLPVINYFANSCKICECVSTFTMRRSSRTVVEAEAVTISYTNPMIYEKMVADITPLVQGLTYTPAKVKHRGNPAFQAGDIVTVPDKDGNYHTVLIMQQTMNFGGGMNSEISCPGQTNKSKSFSANNSLNTQISQKIEQSSSEIERKLSANNSLVYASIYKTISNTEAKVQNVVEWQNEKAATLSSMELAVKSNSASIKSLTKWKDETSTSISLIEQKVDRYGAGIELFVEYDAEGVPKASASLLIEAINGESLATINADKINLNGVVTANETFKIDTDGSMYATGGKIATWVINTKEIHSSQGVYGEYKYSVNGVDWSYMAGWAFVALADTGILYYIKDKNDFSSTTLAIVTTLENKYGNVSYMPVAE